MLNGTQKAILDATIHPLLNEFLEDNMSSDMLRMAFDRIKKNTSIPPSHHQAFFELDMLASIKQLQGIYHHPYVQNRSIGSPYVDQVQGWVAYEPNGYGKGVEKEREGMLGLTTYNDSTAVHVTREDVIAYLDEQFQATLAKGETHIIPLSSHSPQPSAPPLPTPSHSRERRQRPSDNSATLFTQAVVDFSDALRARLLGDDRYDPQAPNAFLGSILSAIRRDQWNDLCQQPENYSIPRELLGFVYDYVNEHPLLRPSAQHHTQSQRIESTVNASEPDQLSRRLNAMQVSAYQLSNVGMHAPQNASVPELTSTTSSDVTLAHFAQSVLTVYENLQTSMMHFPGFEKNTQGIILATFLRCIRKDNLEAFYTNPEDIGGVPKAIVPLLQTQLAKHPALLAAKTFPNECHKDIEKKYLRANDIEGLRTFISDQANTVSPR